MSEEAADGAEVTVEVTATDPPPEAPTGDTTVVVTDAGDAGIHPAMAQFMAEQAAINERLLARMDTTEVVASDAAVTSEVAASTVSGAVEEVQAVGEQVSATIAENQPASTPDGDIAPKHSEHRWYRHRARD